MNFNHSSRTAFTIVELVVSISILVVLSSIAFISLGGNISESRDAKRVSDFATIQTALKVYKQGRGSYPLPGDAFNITYSGSIVATQGLLNSKVVLSTLDFIPTDPEIKVSYIYSLSASRKEFQIAGTLENKEESKALVQGSYSSVSKNVLPSLVFAKEGPSDHSIDTEINRRLSLFNESTNNYPYTFDTPFSPHTNSISLADLLLEAETNKQFWQNSDYRSCTEILDAGKSIGDGEYQILNTGTNTFTDTNCTGM